MQRLCLNMMERYEIPNRLPGALRAVQFGMDETLLATVDRLLDDAGLDLGIACVQAGEAGFARRLNEQDGLFTLIIRGYQGEQAVRREQVVQALRRVIDPEADFDAFTALAKEPELSLGLLNADVPAAATALGLAARFLAERWRSQAAPLSFIVCGASADCADRARDLLAEIAAPWGLGEGFEHWLCEANAFYPALADSLAFRSEAKEAAKLCADMNYRDEMLHIAEPYARLTVQAPPAFRALWPLDRAEGIAFVDDLSGALEAYRLGFETGLILMGAPGWLLGCDTLSDCMRHERLRAFVGGALHREALADPALRQRLAPAVIQAFERYENPLNRNDILRACQPLFRRLRRTLVPAARAWAEERFEPPRGLSFALAAAIMLYAGARPGPDGVYQVARGHQTAPLYDDADVLETFSTLSHDMPAESLAYAVLADRALWRGEDLRQIDGLEARVALDIAAIQRDPGYCPGEAELAEEG